MPEIPPDLLENNEVMPMNAKRGGPIGTLMRNCFLPSTGSISVSQDVGNAFDSGGLKCTNTPGIFQVDQITRFVDNNQSTRTTANR
uniref:Uncharacterized protein n=1 Tax=Moniliophthora roreri TaxID=221103 RepID=A0A0W0FYC9_MONRR